MDNHIHIWELPEKLNDIDKSTEYSIVHDGAVLKKVTLEKIFEYFSQDYKMDNLTRYFNVLMTEAKRYYDDLQEELSLSLDNYNRTIEILSDKFKEDRTKFREVTTSINQTGFDVLELSNTYEYRKGILVEMSMILDSMDEEQTDREERMIVVENTVKDMKTAITEISSIKDISTNISSAKTSFTGLEENINKKISEETKEFTKKIDEEYNKMVNIFKYYHYIEEISEETLVDFEYTKNENGTYTLTNWKETLNGESSTEMIIPDNRSIIL